MRAVPHIVYITNYTTISPDFQYELLLDRASIVGLPDKKDVGFFQNYYKKAQVAVAAPLFIY